MLTKMKSVLVIDAAATKPATHYYDTLKEAQDALPNMLKLMTEPHVYTLFSHGVQRVAFDWTILTDTATNLREIRKNDQAKKVVAKRSGAYSQIEKDTLKDMYDKGFAFKVIAEKLFRTENSVYQKAIGMGIHTTEPRTKKGKKPVVKKGLEERREDIAKRNAALN